MKKILISGMTASQSSSVYSERSATFIGSIADALRSAGIAVDWQAAELDGGAIKSYDHVLVGVAPILSLAANKSFSALTLIESLWKTDKLTLFIDAPEPAKIHASLRSATKSPESIVKPLYARRPGYSKLKSDKKHANKVFSLVESMTHDKWNKTLIPMLPWSSVDASTHGVPQNIASSCVGINVDSYILNGSVSSGEHRYNQWVVEAPNTKWIKNTSSSLMFPTVRAKIKKTDIDKNVIENMQSSIGVLIGPHDDKILWWSSRFAQAMNTATPVATEWRSSSMIGDSWSHLACGIEEMSQADREELSSFQREQYTKNIPGKEQVAELLLKELGIK